LAGKLPRSAPKEVGLDYNSAIPKVLMAGDTHKLLNDLVADSTIERLERGLQKFNIFSALGVERLEVQHSNFLAYLLNPLQKHGLEDRFLRKFLQAALRDSSDSDLKISPIEVDTWELRRADVQRERRNTDIFVTDGTHFAMVIENKVDSSEHDDQLTRYRTELAKDFPARKRILLYLTPAGAPPEQDEETKHWIPVDYECIEKVLTKEIIDVSAELHLNDEVEFALRQYIEILRRFIVADSDDAKGCRAFYRKHRVALDLIRDQVNQQRVRLMAEARRLLEEEVKSDDHLELDHSTNTEIGFVSRNVDKELPKGGTATKTGRMLLFFLGIEQVGISFVVSVAQAMKMLGGSCFGSQEWSQ
jgi:hypothetical protein